MSTPDDEPDLATAQIEDLDDGGDATAMFDAHDFAGRYAGGGLLGAGGMGEVRLFRDRLSGRSVAAKMMRTDARAGNALRFAREARIQAQLEHPAIVPVYDLGLDDRGALYFTMKRVRGETLDRVLSAVRGGRADVARRYSPRRLLSILSTVAMAIEFAHERGVIHRDLKPSNIMLGPHGEVYVLDWGLALVGASGREPEPVDITSSVAIEVPAAPLVDSSQPPSTGAGQLLGTPGYLAPEQVRTGDVDRRSDVYALGAILFEILAVRRLHVGQTLAEILISTLSIDGASPLALAPDCGAPPELDALCRRATRRAAIDRLGTAAELADAIEAYLDGDRDLVQRRKLAAERAVAAAGALDRATGGDDDAGQRNAALRDVTAALALDPDNAAARATLLRLLTAPSRAAEEDAAAAARADARDANRVAARNSALAHLTYALYLPFLFWMGVRHAWMLGAMAAAIGTAVAISYAYYRRPPATSRVPLPLFAASTVALLTGVTLFGPLVLLPAVVIAGTVAYIASVNQRHALVIAVAIAVVIVPTLLQAIGVLPASYELVGGELRVRPMMASFSPTATWTFLLVTQCVLIATTGVFVSQLRRRSAAVEQRLRTQAAQLARLVPDEVRERLAPITSAQRR